MELIHIDKRDGFLYDPAIKGLDANFWSNIVGTPTTTGSGAAKVIQLNAQTMASYVQDIFSDIEFGLTVPNAPVGGQSPRRWGFLSPAQNNAGFITGAVYFETSGANFRVQVYDNANNNMTTALTWIAGYTNTFTRFRIRWEKDQIKILINDVVKATIPATSASASVPTVDMPVNPLPIWIENQAADNMLVNYVLVRRAASII